MEALKSSSDLLSASSSTLYTATSSGIRNISDSGTNETVLTAAAAVTTDVVACREL